MFTREKIHNIGFIATRLKGTDGVSLETAKWSMVLERMGYTCYFFAGLSNWDNHRTTVFEEAYFDHPKVDKIQSKCFGKFTRNSELTGKIHHLRQKLKHALYEFIEQHQIGLIVPQNALTIPMHVPFGVAITELIAETGIPTIAHHHDFYWERQRFMVNCVGDFLSLAFPPSLPSIQHVVINTPAARELSYRTGLSSHIIPNVLNFEKPAPKIDEYSKDVRIDLGLDDDDIFILQPTRIVARKGIEHAIEIVARLKNPKAKLVISHSAGDEGLAYEERIKGYAQLMGVPLIIKPGIIGTARGLTPEGKKIYTLWDVYPHADLVTYPSMYEGFGNAFLETIYFRKPLVVNRYSIYEMDIEPMGFEVITMDGYVTDKVIRKIKKVLRSPGEQARKAEKNYQLASQFFSFELLAYKLMTILIHFEGLVGYSKPS